MLGKLWHPRFPMQVFCKSSFPPFPPQAWLVTQRTAGASAWRMRTVWRSKLRTQSVDYSVRRQRKWMGRRQVGHWPAFLHQSSPSTEFANAPRQRWRLISRSLAAPKEVRSGLVLGSLHKLLNLIHKYNSRPSKLNDRIMEPTPDRIDSWICYVHTYTVVNWQGRHPRVL